MAHDRELAGSIVAGACLTKAFSRGRIGVFVGNPPPLAPDSLVRTLGQDSPEPLRVAILGAKERLPRGTAKIDITGDLTVANKWRNDTSKAKRRLVVVAFGDLPKVRSLKDALGLVTTLDLRRQVAQRCISLLDTPERRAFYSAVSEADEQVSTSLFIDFASHVAGLAARSKAALLQGEARELWRIGLLPSESMFAPISASASRNQIARNRTVVQDLENLSTARFRQLSQVSDGGGAHAVVASQIIQFSQSRAWSLLSSMTLESVRDALAAKADGDKKKTDTTDRSKADRRERIEGNSLALDIILNAEGRGLGKASERFANAVKPSADGDGEPEEITVGHRRVQPRPSVGSSQAASLFARLVSDSHWGGVVTAREASDLVAAQRQVASGDADVEEFQPDAEKDVAWSMSRAVDQGVAPKAAIDAWRAYANARSKLLPYSEALIDHPLLALGGSKQCAEAARHTMECYGSALTHVTAVADGLEERGSIEAARRLMACFLRLDVAFVQTVDEMSAIAAPTHPFHLWRWLTLHSLLSEHRDEMMQIGQDALEPLVTDPPAACPQLVLSPFGSRSQSDRTRSFVPVGTFASLPLFCEASGRNRGKFRPRSLVRIAERLLRLLPHASYGLRVILVDPPSAVSVLDELMDLESALDDNQPVPIHAAVLRTRLSEDSTDEEEVEVASLVRELADHGGSLSVLPAVKGLDVAAKEVEDFRPHLTVVFDPGEGEAVSVGLSHPPSLSPLVVPRAYRYDAFDDRLDVVIAGNAEPFSTYHNMLCRSIGVPRTDFIGRRSGASRSLRQLEAISRGSLWTVVVDQGVEPTFRLGSTRQLDVQSESGRDIVTFTSHPETVEDLIADAIRQAGMVPDPDSVARVLRDLFQLNGQVVLALARAKPGGSLADPRIAKGILGVLTASRWYTERYPDALIISLDEPLSQRWILGVNADDRHGDLVGVRPSESGIVLEAIEVKAHDDPSTPYSLSKGIVNGKAAVQIDQTLRSLKAIFAEPPSSPVIAARRDILRDQLYRAVASRPYRPEQRARFVGVLDELFTKGPAEFAGVICRVRNTSGGERDWPESGLSARTGDGNAVKIAELAEGTSAVVLGPSKSNASTEAREAKGSVDEVTAGVNGTNPDRVAGGSPSLMPTAAKEPAESSNTDTRVSTPTGASGSARVRVLIGTTDSGREIYWDPQLPENPLNNFGVLITGDPGSGKTQMIRAILAEACNRNLPVCVFDFKNDYTDTDDGPNGPDRFASRHGLVVHDIDKSGLPFNPLALLPDAKGECQPIRQVHELASILRRVFSLGDQQEARLKQAMSACYEAKGIKPGNRVVVSTVKQTPSFSDVKEHLEHDDKNEALLNRLSPLFDLGLFPSSKSAATTFDAMMQTRVVLDLHNLPDDRIKAAMSEFIIVRLHGLTLKGSQPRELRRLLVFDEAWRVKDSVRLQELAREGRAFGVGIVVGTQFPGDIPENLAGNLATQLLLANQDPDHQRVVVRTLCGTGAGSEAARLQRQVAVLQKHQGFFRNQQMAPFCLLTTLPYWRRVTPGTS